MEIKEEKTKKKKNNTFLIITVIILFLVVRCSIKNVITDTKSTPSKTKTEHKILLVSDLKFNKGKSGIFRKLKSKGFYPGSYEDGEIRSPSMYIGRAYCFKPKNGIFEKFPIPYIEVYFSEYLRKLVGFKTELKIPIEEEIDLLNKVKHEYNKLEYELYEILNSAGINVNTLEEVTKIIEGNIPLPESFSMEHLKQYVDLLKEKKEGLDQKEHELYNLLFDSLKSSFLSKYNYKQISNSLTKDGFLLYTFKNDKGDICKIHQMLYDKTMIYTLEYKSKKLMKYEGVGKAIWSTVVNTYNK